MFSMGRLKGTDRILERVWVEIEAGCVSKDDTRGIE
jgi:hypothetical protein